MDIDSKKDLVLKGENQIDNIYKKHVEKIAREIINDIINKI